nr:unnamed protein product [Rangifer tarandus platyrhynchus]
MCILPQDLAASTADGSPISSEPVLTLWPLEHGGGSVGVKTTLTGAVSPQDPPGLQPWDFVGSCSLLQKLGLLRAFLEVLHEELPTCSGIEEINKNPHLLPKLTLGYDLYNAFESDHRTLDSYRNCMSIFSEIGPLLELYKIPQILMRARMKKMIYQQKRKGVEGLIDIENPNWLAQITKKVIQVDLDGPKELSRREREEIEIRERKSVP